MSSFSSDRAFASRDASLDALRGILVIFVLILHAEMVSGIGRTSAIGYLNMTVGPVLMPLFFAMSGLLGGRSLERNWSDFLSSQVLRLLWPFLIWGLVYACFVSLVEEKVPLGVGLLVSLALKPTELGPVWYLHFLLACFVLAKATRRVSPVVTMALLAACAISAAAFWGSSPTIFIHGSSFFLGLSISRYPAMMQSTGTNRFVLQILPLAVIAFLLVAPHAMGDSLRDNGLALPLVLLACVVIINHRHVVENVFGARFVVWVGIHSLPIYLIHWPVMLIVWRVAAVDSSLQFPEVFWLALITAMLIGSIFAHFANRSPYIGMLFAPPRKLLKEKARR